MDKNIRPFDRRVQALKLFAWRPFLLAMASLLATTLHAATSARVIITNEPGFTITWDGNNGGFSNPNPGAGPSNNIALAANGTVAFASSEYGVVHFVPNLNDGLYGNLHSWIPSPSDADPFCGLVFPSAVLITNIAWSRDNGDTTPGDTGCGGTCVDRNVGTYTLQYTTVLTPDVNTTDTGDASTGWATIGTVTYASGADDVNFTGYLRHRFDIQQNGAAFEATAIRIKTAAIDPSNDIDIDEIEVNPIADLVPPLINYIELTPATGFNIAWDKNEGNYSTANSPAPVPVNDASTNRGAVAFGSSQLDFGVHFIRNVNDGLYGNAHSWIPDFAANPDPNPSIGISFGKQILLRNIAWGRDNGDVAGDCCGGTLTDRALGVYTLQVTTVANPGVATPEVCGANAKAGWVTIGTFNYKADFPGFFTSYLRHRFSLSQNGVPIAATGIRIFVPNNQSDIDEIEVNALDAAITITNMPGVQIAWDGNNGEFYSADSGAAPPDNIALAGNGSIPIGSSELAYLGTRHFIADINDGLYGNENSWISANGLGAATDPDPWIGVVFPTEATITNIAWSRDNGDATSTDPGCPSTGYTCMERVLGTYTLQYTQAASPDATTPETGDAATGWATLGGVTYSGALPPVFTPYLRHRFDIAATPPLTATALRVKVSDGLMDLDELEVNTAVNGPTPPVVAAVGITANPGYRIAWDGNDGQFFDPNPGAVSPDNIALASHGATAFGSSELGEVLGLSFHRWTNVNDGLYGNSFSWISANGLGTINDPDPWVGVSFADMVSLTNIAWSRDNGDNVEFQGTDRTLGTYTLQYTVLPFPDATMTETEEPGTGWATLGTITYRANDPPLFISYLRHRFDISADGLSIEATAIRLKVSDGTTDIDEIEVNTPLSPPPPKLSVTAAGGTVVISWSGGGSLQTATSVKGPWACAGDTGSPYTVPVGAGPTRFYRAQQ
jgi:hypothetical protein